MASVSAGQLALQDPLADMRLAGRAFHISHISFQSRQ